MQHFLKHRHATASVIITASLTTHRDHLTITMAGKRVPSQVKPTTPHHPPEQAATADDEPLVSSEEAPLDPRTSTRRYWRDPNSGTQREIWRPGDGDGDIEHDHFERKGPAAPLGKRWRLYQVSNHCVVKTISQHYRVRETSRSWKASASLQSRADTPILSSSPLAHSKHASTSHPAT